MNWIDAVIVVVVAYFLVAGWEQGIIHLVASLISFVISLWLALQLHGYVATFMTEKFDLPAVWTVVLGYVLVGFVAEAVISTGLRVLADKVPVRFLGSKVNHWAGAVVSVLNALLIVAFFLLLILALPIRGSVKDDIRTAFIGSRLLAAAHRYGGTLETSVTDVVNKAQEFMTIAPQSGEEVVLNITTPADQLQVDEGAESNLIARVNEEREKIGLSPLFVDTKMVDVARAYSRKMILDKRFSHVDTEGQTAAERLSMASVVFVRAGENLAFAPDVATAHQGLMDSESHRINILDRRFRRIGVGIIRAGDEGLVITQLFAD